MNSIKEKLKQYILTNHLTGKSISDLGDDVLLRSSGILDSLGTMSLISFIESEFKIEFSAVELATEKFDRIDQIANLIARKLQK